MFPRLQCRFKHTRLPGPPPDPELLEACKPKEFRNINIVANQANEGILPPMDPNNPQRLRLTGPEAGQHQLALAQQIQHRGGRGGHGGRGGQAPNQFDQSLLAAVGQQDLRYGF